MLLHGHTENQLLTYFRTVPEVQKHHTTTIKQKKCKWFQYMWDFLWMDVAAGGTQPAKSKNEAFSKLEWPHTCGDLGVLIRVFGLYSHLFPIYDMEIRPCSYILLKYHQVRKISQKEEMEQIQNLWTSEYQMFLERLNTYIVPGPTIARTHPYIRLYKPI